MKILFMRHGESVDDLENRYGGWADFSLSYNGKTHIEARLKKLIESKVQFEAIYSSTFNRAFESAAVLSKGLVIPVIPLEYLKERNSYGILSGMKKDEAKQKYPDLVEKLKTGEYIYGCERNEDFLERVKKAIDLLKNQRYSTIIVVTHGNFLKFLSKEFLNKKIRNVEDGGCLNVEIEENFKLLSSDGIEFEDLKIN